jgi:diguanylate cyclase (GGDEF)-like protein/PAS domain S-box-containing protein
MGADDPGQEGDAVGELGSQGFWATQNGLRTILTGIPGMVGYWDRDLRNRLANDAYVEFFGLTPDQIHGMHIRDVLGQKLYKLNRPHMDRALAGEEQLFDREIPTLSGERRYTQASYVPDVVDGEVRGFFVLVTDISARRAAETALAEEQERFRTLFESVPIGALILGPGGRIIDLNAAASRVFARSREQLTGVTVLDITHPDDRAETAERLERVAAGEVDAFRMEKRFVDAHGETIWAQVDATRLGSGDDWRLVEQIQDVSERHHHEQQLVHLADHDALTGLLNRRALARELDRLQSVAERYSADGALVLVDLDHFKNVNDTLGHKAGDDLIVGAADLLRARARDTDIVARLGGDEFAILLPRGTAEEAEELAGSLVDIFDKWVPLPAIPETRITASIGVAGLAPGQSGGELLMHADLAMYDAKEAGRDSFVRYAEHPFKRPKIESRIAWMGRIRNALANDGFRLMSQPIINPHTGQVAAHELLIRMLADDGSLIVPDTFLYIAEHFDLIQPIDCWVITQACDLLQDAHNAGEPLSLSVNVSGKSLLTEAYADCLAANLNRTGVNPHDLILEITETATIANIHRARAFAQVVRELGCRLAIDDFGVGFGSFYYLKHLPFDILKIDGEFVTSARTSHTDALIVRSVRDLAHGMNTLVVAEFCADQQIHDWLVDNDIDLVQGYHLAAPAPVETTLLRPR